MEKKRIPADVVFEGRIGEDIHDVIDFALWFANMTRIKVFILFNGERIYVEPFDSHDSVYKKYIS